jgi:hypothetical protein
MSRVQAKTRRRKPERKLSRYAVDAGCHSGFHNRMIRVPVTNTR